jgi:peptide/nickel transport system ATP-binding protein
MKLALRDVSVRFGDRVVSHVASLDVDAGQITGLAGESGSGKSMAIQAVLGLAGFAGASVTGSIKLDGLELVGLSESRLRAIRGRRVAAIFQSPALAFNPVFRVGTIVTKTLRLHGLSSGEAKARADAAMRSVLLDPSLLKRYPSQLSGGQLQRVAIALALALRAEVLLADEPTSALDVTVQAEVLELLRELRDERGMAILFVSHDLAVIAELCDRVAIMRSGEIVEQGPCDQVVTAPSHEYTRELLAAVPTVLAPGGRPPQTPPKEV